MRVVTNKQQANIRRVGQIIRITLIAASTLIITSTIILVGISILLPGISNTAVPIIIMGVLSAIVGLQMGTLLKQLPAPHETLNARLKGFPKGATLYHYYLPADHVLITPQGIFTLTTFTQEASLAFRGNRCRTTENILRRIWHTLTQIPIGNPIRKALRDARATETWLRQHFPDTDIPIQPLLIFANPRSKISIVDDPPIPIAFLDNRKPSAKAFIREQSTPTLSAEQIQQLDTILRIQE